MSVIESPRLEDQLANLPENVRRALTDFVDSTRNAFSDDLRSIVLYGSAAEGRLRRTSDVNLVVVLSKFDHAKAERLRQPLRIAQAAIRLKTMFLLESEIAPATEAFAVKFGDIARRHRTLHGVDPFAGLKPSRPAAITRLNQTLLNLTLRSREAYVTRGLREEQLGFVIADAAGPLRACAAALLELEGATAASPKEALEDVARAMPQRTEHEWAEVLSLMSAAREEGRLEPGLAGPTVVALIDLAMSMQARARKLS
ncbi:MAG: nucleotidyltransferase domain-containing protein [Acidobacteriota bacterium]